MPIIDLKIPIAFELGNVNSDLKPGRHAFTDEQMDSWFIKGLIENGSIVIVTKKKKEEPKEKPLDYSNYKITLGEGGKPVRIDKISIPAIINEPEVKIKEPEKESKWEKIVGKDEDLDKTLDVSNLSNTETAPESGKQESLRPKIIRTKKVIK